MTRNTSSSADESKVTNTATVPLPSKGPTNKISAAPSPLPLKTDHAPPSKSKETISSKDPKSELPMTSLVCFNSCLFIIFPNNNN